AAVAIEVVHGHHVGMRELLGLAALALQRFEGLRMAAESLVQQLQSDPGIAVLSFLLTEVARLEDHAHATAPELLFEHEAILHDTSGPERRGIGDSAPHVGPTGAGGP